MSFNTTPDKIDFKVETDLESRDDDIKANHSHEENAQVSLGTVLKGKVGYELTPFERKAALINA